MLTDKNETRLEDGFHMSPATKGCLVLFSSSPGGTPQPDAVEHIPEAVTHLHRSEPIQPSHFHKRSLIRPNAKPQHQSATSVRQKASVSHAPPPKDPSFTAVCSTGTEEFSQPKGISRFPFVVSGRIDGRRPSRTPAAQIKETG